MQFSQQYVSFGLIVKVYGYPLSHQMDAMSPYQETKRRAERKLPSNKKHCWNKKSLVKRET